MDKIQLIKEVRDKTGCGLREAKETVEECLNGEGTPDMIELIAKAVERAKNRPPRSEEARMQIRNNVKGIKLLVAELEEYCEGDFDESVLSGIRVVTECIADHALIIKGKLSYKLEETLYTERQDSE